MFPGIPARISDMRNRFSALSVTGPPGRRAAWQSWTAGRRAVTGRGPRAAGPSGRRAAAPSRAVGRGPLGRGPAFSKTPDIRQIDRIELFCPRIESIVIE